MRPAPQTYCSKESAVERIKNMLKSESKDLAAKMKANSCYLSDAEKLELLNEIKETLNVW